MKVANHTFPHPIMNNNLPQRVPLSALTTLQVGGSAAVWQVTTESELKEAITYAEQQGLGWRVLGGGSNVLAPDEGVRDLVLNLKLAEQQVTQTDDHVLLTVEAGATLDEVIQQTVEQGWWGLENLSHIPGTVGATPIQNVGAYGVEAKDVIASVRVFDPNDQSVSEWSVADCQFGYRTSAFKRPENAHRIVTAVTYKLATAAHPKLTYRDLAEAFPHGTTDQAAIRSAIIEIRSRKFPDWHTVGTAGSFFKNPIIPLEQFQTLQATYPDLPGFPVAKDTYKVPLGYILDKILGLRGVSEGAVGTYEGQALVIINHGGATAAEITAFAERITTAVKDETGIAVEWEVTRW